MNGSDRERMVQFGVAAAMVVAGAVVFLMSRGESTAATVGGTVIAAILGLGSIVLAQDGKPKG